MEKQCKKCQVQFKITDEDLKFYDKVSPVFAGKKYQIPFPTLCPECRDQRRLSFRNERKLYNRKSSLSEKEIISIFSEDKPYQVYETNEWWSDEVDTLKFGRNFDFNKNFFSQFNNLMQVVPFMNLIGSKNEGSAFCNLAAQNKSSYLLIESSNNENCYYGYWLQVCLQCLDSSYSHESQYCYEIENCQNCYKLFYSRNCKNCSNSFFLDNCSACKDCFACTNLNQKQYCIENKQYTEQEYKNFLKDFKSGSVQEIKNWQTKLQAVSQKAIKKYAKILNSENCTGDYITNSKDCINAFHIHEAEQCKYAEHVWKDSKFAMDVSTIGLNAELIYDSINTALSAYNVLFGIQQWTTRDSIYCYGCFNSSNCFGCIGLKHKQYCILNKQYSKEEYESLVPKIIDKMITDGQWGEFFPSALSPFGYNETVAQEYFPLSKDQALSLGFNWSDYQSPPPSVSKIIPAHLLPDSITDIPDDILNWAIECEVTKKPFRIIKQELQFYRDHNLPIPRKHPDQRHKERMSLRNPRKLWDRNCMKCNKEIQTTYSPHRPEIIYCEDCYLKEVY